MAIEAQGVVVRRQSTTASSTGQSSGLTIAFTTIGVTRSDAGSFLTDNMATGMRVETDSTANSTRVFTISGASATSMTFYETAIAQSTGTNLSLTGHSMENIGQVMSFTGPSGSAGVIDITHLGSTAKEKLIGIRDEGQLSLELLTDLANATSLHTALKDDRASRTKRQFDLKLTDETTVAGSQPTGLYFQGYVTNYSLAGGVDDAIKSSLTLEITSAVRTIDRV